jgi:hypothetical protein
VTRGLWAFWVSFVALVLILLGIARWSGAGWDARARDVAIADSAAAAAVHRVAAKRRAAIAAGRVYVGTIAPHVAAKGATNRVLARNDSTVKAALALRDSAIAAAADTLRALPELRLELRRSADQITGLTAALEATRDTVLQERALAEDRILAAVAAARAQDALVAAQDALDGAREDQVATRDARRPSWLRRALGATCQAVTTVGGAGLGALAGPGGAMLGAGAGLAGGALACR